MPVMLDWLSLVAPCTTDGPIDGGAVVTLDHAGRVEWERPRRLMLTGSYDQRIAVKSRGEGQLELSGSPAKYLQGHNLFGPGDLPAVAYALLDTITERLGLDPTPQDRAAWAAGEYDLTRVDLTRMYDLGTPERVRHFLAACAPVARTRHQRASVYDSSTVYVGQRSSRFCLKLYDKHAELKRHPLSGQLPPRDYERLTAWAAGKLRVELTVRSKELQERGLRRGAVWSPAVAESLLDERLGRLELNATLRLADDTLDGLPGRLVAVYDAWQAGRDLRTLFSRPTFYRHRRELQAYGIDISRPRLRLVVPADQHPAGQPLRSFITGPGCDVPPWAVGTPLLAPAPALALAA